MNFSKYIPDPRKTLTRENALYLLKQTKRLIILIIGLTVLLFGIVLIVLPGPALVVIPLALAILATEFVWAERVLQRIKKKLGLLKHKFSK